MAYKITNPVSIKRLENMGLSVQEVEKMVDTKGVKETQDFLSEAYKKRGQSKENLGS
jgi:hypothetical protein